MDFDQFADQLARMEGHFAHGPVKGWTYSVLWKVEVRDVKGMRKVVPQFSHARRFRNSGTLYMLSDDSPHIPSEIRIMETEVRTAARDWEQGSTFLLPDSLYSSYNTLWTNAETTKGA